MATKVKPVPQTIKPSATSAVIDIKAVIAGKENVPLNHKPLNFSSANDWKNDAQDIPNYHDFKNDDDDDDDQKILDDDDTQYKENIRNNFFQQNSDLNVPIKPIYFAAKEIDDKYQLIFKPECNYKNCNNLPVIDSSLIAGDMYICKKHRIKIANKLKQKNKNNPILKKIILKLKTYDDKHYYEEGKRLENNDYFLTNYSKIQQMKLQIAKKLFSFPDAMSSEYWKYILLYKQLDEQSKLLCNIRKTSNPFLLGLLSGGMLSGGMLSGGLLVLGAGVLAIIGYTLYQTRQQKNDDKIDPVPQPNQPIGPQHQPNDPVPKPNYNDEKIQESQDACEALNNQFFENDHLKRDCVLKINGRNISVDYQKQLQLINNKIGSYTTAISNLDNEMKQIKQKTKDATFAEIKKFKKELEKKENEKRKYEQEMQKEKRRLDEEKRKKELRKPKAGEDEFHWQRAKNRAQDYCRNTPSGKVAVYVVYDSREAFSSGCSAYSPYRNHYWVSDGNYKICKFEALYQSHAYNKFTFTASGRYTYCYHPNDPINGRHRISKNGDSVTVEL